MKYLKFNLLLIIFSTATFAQKQSTKAIETSNGYTTNCPFLTNDNKGNLVLSFGTENEKGESTFSFAYLNTKTNKFGKPIEIKSAKDVKLHGENAPKIAFKSDGTIIAVWGIDNSSETKKYGGLIFYSQSFNNGITWTDATPLVKDKRGIDQRYFDIDKLSNGEIAIVWLDNRTDTNLEGSTLYYAATKGKLGFQNEKPIAETTCQCCRTDLSVTKKGTINVAFRDIINEEIRDMSICFSNDNGNTFSKPKRISADDWKISGCPHTGPTIAENNQGLHFAWYTMGNGSGVYYCNSIDKGLNFSKRDIVSSSASAKHPQITTSKDQSVNIVWDEIKKINGVATYQIGYQKRDKNGKIIISTFISDNNQNATFPVIKHIQDNNLLIAWVNRDSPENIYYKVIKTVN